MEIDEIHEYLDQIEDVIAFLNSTDQETVSDYEIQNLSVIVSEMFSWKTAYGDGPALGISPSVLNRYVKHQGPFHTREAKVVAQRVRSFLRSQDQPTHGDEAPASKSPPLGAPPSEPSARPQADPTEQLTIRGEGWQIIGPSTDLKVKIHALSMLLDEIVQRVRGTNTPPERQALTQLERAQLITLLETTLAVLKAPMVELGLLKRAGKMLSQVVRKSVEKQVEEGLGSLADMAASEITDIVTHLPDQFTGP